MMRKLQLTRKKIIIFLCVLCCFIIGIFIIKGFRIKKREYDVFLSGIRITAV